MQLSGGHTAAFLPSSEALDDGDACMQSVALPIYAVEVLPGSGVCPDLIVQAAALLRPWPKIEVLSPVTYAALESQPF